MSIAFVRSIILYILIVFSVRLMGKRQIGELQPSELVVTILVSNIATLPLEDPSLPIMMGIIPIFVLVCLDVLMSGATLKFRRLRGIVSGTPKVIIKDGVLDQNQLKALRFSIDDVMESLRAYNIFDISEVQFALVETTGKISVFQKFPYQNATPEMLSLKGKSANPPSVIIDDGVLIEDALAAIKRGKGWLDTLLLEKNLELKAVFLLTASEDGSYNLIKRELK